MSLLILAFFAIVVISFVYSSIHWAIDNTGSTKEKTNDFLSVFLAFLFALFVIIILTGSV